jgi:hypothetical protein
MWIATAKSGTIVENNHVQLDGIVISADAPHGVKRAANEITYYLKQMTGKTIPTIVENINLPHGKYIYLGACQKNQSLGIVSNNWSKNHGCILVDVHNIYIAGKDDKGYFWRSNVSTGTLFATYEFLEKYLGIRWLWPGKLGEVIPANKNITIPNILLDTKPKLLASRWRMHPLWRSTGWSSLKNRTKFYQDQVVWLKHHRFCWDSEFEKGHAFTGYFKKYGKSNPEFFNLLPDGTRRPNPYNWSSGNPKYISMCVTSPSLWKKIVQTWAAKSPRPRVINLNENDSAGNCVCSTCLSADNSKIPDKIRLKKATGKFREKKRAWVAELGSVSDRYCQFYLGVQKMADKIDPHHRIMGLIYANYSEPPTNKIKLNERIILRFCPPFMYPWTNKKIMDYKKIWNGWGKTGAKLVFRPNFTHDGGGFPIEYQDVFYELFMFSAKNGMIASDMDSLTGHYAAQGPANYVIASLNHNWNSTLTELENDFFSAFGAAKDLVKKYFDYQKQVSMKSNFVDPFAERGIEGGRLYLDLFLVADTLFTPDVMKKSYAILNEAHNLPNLKPIAKKRVEFLQIGLKNVQLTINAQREFRKYEKGIKNNFSQAVKTLDAFRASVESTNAINVGNLRFLENRHWPRPSRKILSNSTEIKNWKILWDPQNIGISKEWFKPTFDRSNAQAIGTNSHWEKQPAGIKWRNKHGSNYRGVAWYYNNLENIKKDKLKTTSLYFSAVDGTATVFLNSVKIAYHPYPFKGNVKSWKEPFEVKIPAKLLTKEKNLLVIRVEKHTGLCGIWRPVFLKYL